LIDRGNHVQTQPHTDPLAAATTVPFALVHNPFTGLEALSLAMTG
jgi:hypothetical protein